MIRIAWIGLILLVITPPMSAITIGASLLGVRGGIYDYIVRTWCRIALFASGARVHAEGLSNVDLDRPQVFVSNHQSWFDVLSIAATIPKRSRFVAKKELARVPVWGRAWLAAGHIAIDRQDTQAAIRELDRAGELIREDNSGIIIFPEGTRSPDGRLLPFKKGAFRLAQRLSVDVIPVGVSGSREILPRDGWRVRPGEIIVRFGRPIPCAAIHVDRTDELITRVRSDIENLLSAPQSAGTCR